MGRLEQLSAVRLRFGTRSPLPRDACGTDAQVHASAGTSMCSFAELRTPALSRKAFGGMPYVFSHEAIRALLSYVRVSALPTRWSHRRWPCFIKYVLLHGNLSWKEQDPISDFPVHTLAKPYWSGTSRAHIIFSIFRAQRGRRGAPRRSLECRQKPSAFQTKLHTHCCASQTK